MGYSELNLTLWALPNLIQLESSRLTNTEQIVLLLILDFFLERAPSTDIIKYGLAFCCKVVKTVKYANIYILSDSYKSLYT